MERDTIGLGRTGAKMMRRLKSAGQQRIVGARHLEPGPALAEVITIPAASHGNYERFNSRRQPDFRDKMLSALLYKFGGRRKQRRHAEDDA